MPITGTAFTVAAIHQRRLSAAIRASFLAEVNALKPGNVNRLADAHGMTVNDFLISADLVAPVLADPGLDSGEKILNSVRITRSAVGCNTNLGMVLLFAPVTVAFYRDPDPKRLASGLRAVLRSMKKNQTNQIFEAIRMAEPGGLGHAAKYDVHFHTDADVLVVMQAAAERDLVARQYVNGFAEVYDCGLRALAEYYPRFGSVEWAAVGCYLRFLTRYPDSLIVRKYGAKTGHTTMQRAGKLLRQFEKNNDPKRSKAALLDLDRELKSNGVNPGTSADLTAVSLLLYQLGA